MKNNRDLEPIREMALPLAKGRSRPFEGLHCGKDDQGWATPNGRIILSVARVWESRDGVLLFNHAPGVIKRPKTVHMCTGAHVHFKTLLVSRIATRLVTHSFNEG